MKVKSESEVAQSCLTLSNPMDCSLPGSSVHEIFQAKVLEWGAIAFSLGYNSKQNKDSDTFKFSLVERDKTNKYRACQMVTRTKENSEVL